MSSSCACSLRWLLDLVLSTPEATLATATVSIPVSGGDLRLDLDLPLFLALVPGVTAGCFDEGGGGDFTGAAELVPARCTSAAAATFKDAVFAYASALASAAL